MFSILDFLETFEIGQFSKKQYTTRGKLLYSYVVELAFSSTHWSLTFPIYSSIHKSIVLILSTRQKLYTHYFVKNRKICINWVESVTICTTILSSFLLSSFNMEVERKGEKTITLSYKKLSDWIPSLYI